jgi:hypothetical protein
MSIMPLTMQKKVTILASTTNNHFGTWKGDDGDGKSMQCQSL